MKIIHCADLHLDSPMETHLGREKASLRNVEILKTFCRMTAYAAEQNVRLVLIAGDLFDGARVRQSTVDTVLNAIQETPSVTYLYVPGNHDNAAQAFFDRKLPQNFRQFTEQWQSLIYGAVTVSGIEMRLENAERLYTELPCAGEGRFHIVMLHGQIGSQSGVDRVNYSLLRGRGIDYLALGHLHSFTVQPLDARGVYCYSGCLEGRGFDECGEKGFVLIDTDAWTRREEAVRFVPFSQRSLHRIPVDITGKQTNAEVYQVMRTAAAAVPARDMAEFLLRGTASLEARLSVDYLTKLVAGDFFFAKVKDESKLGVSTEDYRNDISLKGAFVRLVLAGDRSEEEKARIIRAGLEALSGEEIGL